MTFNLIWMVDGWAQIENLTIHVHKKKITYNSKQLIKYKLWMVIITTVWYQALAYF